MKKIIIWGAGGRADYYLKNHYFDEAEIECFVDTNKSESKFYDYPVYSTERLREMLDTVDYLVICSKAYLEILKQCISMKLDWNKIAMTENEGNELCEDCFDRLKDIFPTLYKKRQYSKYIRTKKNEYDSVDKTLRIGKGRYSNNEYIDEYFRFRTFELCASEILRKRVPGAVAELGVFNGTFSALINEVFSNRSIYLFDTFEGFEPQEAQYEVSAGRCDVAFIEAHRNSKVENVLEKLPFPEQAIICQGYFPDSIPEKAYDEKFSFVSLDVDFEESTYQGMKFFYPRLNDGGAIFVHDYRTSALEGVEAAVRRYEKELGYDLKCVPIADRAGTLIVLK